MTQPNIGPTCASCRKPVSGLRDNPFFPFCGARCKAVDLARWLGGAYRVAAQSRDEDDDGVGAVEIGDDGGRDGDGEGEGEGEAVKRADARRSRRDLALH